MASKEFPIKDKKHAALFFDKDEKAIGIQPVDAKPGTPAFLITREKGKTLTINCQSFLRHCGISPNEGSKGYPAEWDAKKGMVIVKLN
jgi:hypothetical protein